MTTKPAPDVPEWLVPGAKILIVRTSTGTKRITKTTVAKVTLHSFTVAGSPHRYQIAALGRHEPGTWGARELVIPLDSDEAREHLREAHRKKMVRRASEACQAWIREPSKKRRLEAIEALQAVDEGSPWVEWCPECDYEGPHGSLDIFGQPGWLECGRYGCWASWESDRETNPG